MSSKNFVDVTSELHHVTGGGSRGKAIAKGLKKGWQVGRRALKETASVVQDLGVIGGVGYGAKKVWDAVTGSGEKQQPSPAE